MLSTIAVPASPEVTIAQLRDVDPDLVRDVTLARRRLEQISPKVIALLAEVRALEERVCVAADGIDSRPDNGSLETWRRVYDATGCAELFAAAREIALACPQ